MRLINLRPPTLSRAQNILCFCLYVLFIKSLRALAPQPYQAWTADIKPKAYRRRLMIEQLKFVIGNYLTDDQEEGVDLWPIVGRDKVRKARDPPNSRRRNLAWISFSNYRSTLREKRTREHPVPRKEEGTSRPCGVIAPGF